MCYCGNEEYGHSKDPNKEGLYWEKDEKDVPTKNLPPKRQNSKQLSLSKGYDLPELQWPLDIGSAYSIPVYRAGLGVDMPIPRSAFVSAVVCSPVDVDVQKAFSPKHPTHALWG